MVCATCGAYGEWRPVAEWQTTRDERTAHAAICDHWYEFCDLWFWLAHHRGQRAPYFYW